MLRNKKKLKPTEPKDINDAFSQIAKNLAAIDFSFIELNFHVLIYFLRSSIIKKSNKTKKIINYKIDILIKSFNVILNILGLFSEENIPRIKIKMLLVRLEKNIPLISSNISSIKRLYKKGFIIIHKKKYNKAIKDIYIYINKQIKNINLQFRLYKKKSENKLIFKLILTKKSIIFNIIL